MRNVQVHYPIKNRYADNKLPFLIRIKETIQFLYFKFIYIKINLSNK